MTVLLGAAGVGLLIAAVALILPCAACRKRRERVKAAYAALRQRKDPQKS